MVKSRHRELGKSVTEYTEATTLLAKCAGECSDISTGAE